ncbi:hypothetical protein GCM10027347_52490 [Larkinella harenae]
MPIADYAELETEFAAKPELLNEFFEKRSQDAVKYLTDKGHVVKPKADYDSEVETKATEKATKLNQEAIDNEGAKLYPSIDSMLAIATGKTKPAGMKTRDWVNALADEDLLPFTDAQVAKIKAALKGNGSNPLTEAMVNELKDKLEKLEKGDPEKEAKDLEKQASRVIRTDLRNANVVLDSSLKDSEKAEAKKAAIGDLEVLFKQKYDAHRDDDDEIYFTKKGLKDAKDALVNTAEGRYMTPLEIIKQNHKMFLAVEGRQQQGGGGGGGNSGGGNPNTLDAIYRAAATAGHRFGSAEWKEFVAEKKKAANIQ